MSIKIERASSAFLRARRAELAELLRDAVDGGAALNFAAPLDADTAVDFWEKTAASVDGSEKLVVVAMENDRIIGTGQLVLPSQPNSIHRAEVQKVMVHTSARKKGFGRALMAAVEDEARAVGRTLLFLDTERASDAERLYAKAGYTRVGVVPKYERNHDGTKLVDMVFYYKQLKTLLFLDTERASDAERLYAKAGYTRVGVVPKYERNHDGTKLVDMAFYYKQLR